MARKLPKTTDGPKVLEAVEQSLQLPANALARSWASLEKIGYTVFRPRSAAEIQGAMEKLLTSPELRRELGAAGMAKAQKEYRWRVCARKSLEFFHRA